MKIRKPRIYKVLKVFDKHGQMCWEMDSNAFDKLFKSSDVFEIEGKVSGNLSYGSSEIIVFRTEEKGDTK